MAAPNHLNWLINTGTTLTTADGLPVEVWELHHTNDSAVLSSWAAHFRNHYCKDTDLPALVAGTGLSNSDFLSSLKFPDVTSGASTRAGDFGEILVADFIEYILGYWCPREGRYESRENRNVPSNGCDVIGFKFATPGTESPNDELFILESKASFTRPRTNRLQDAINDSIKDKVRRGMSLNLIKQRLLKSSQHARALMVQRFQDESDPTYIEISGAAAILEDAVFTTAGIAATNASSHPNVGNLKLLVIKGTSMMDLVHHLYQRAAIEA